MKKHYKILLSFRILILSLLGNIQLGYSQCPTFTTSSMVAGCSTPGPVCDLCLSESITLKASGTNLPAGQCVKWYYSNTSGFNPYNGEGTLMGCGNISGSGIVSDVIGAANSIMCDQDLFIVGVVEPLLTGCSQIFTTEFNIHVRCPVAEISVTDTICPDADIQLYGSGGGTYSWSSPTTGFSSNQQNPIIFNSTLPNPNGIYVLTVMDIYGCTAQQATIIEQTSTPTGVLYDPPLAVLAPVIVLCGPGSMVSYVNYTGLTNQKWSFNGWSQYFYFPLYSTDLTTDITIENKTYGVQLIAENGCTWDNWFGIDFTGLNVYCTPFSVLLCPGSSTEVTAHHSNGVGPATYVWSTGATSESIFIDAPGNYTVIGTDALGCTGESSVFGIITPPIDITISGKTFVCHEEDNFITAIGADVGTYPYTYEWDTPSGPLSGETIKVDVSGEYVVHLTDAHGCTATKSITITVLDVDISISPKLGVICKGGGSVQITAAGSGGSGTGYTYYWNTPGGNVTGKTLSANKIGTYTVTVTDSKGCSDTASMTVIQPDQLHITILPNPAGFCNEDTVMLVTNTLGGTPIYDFNWKTPSGTFIGDNFPATKIGLYKVTVTDSHGCKGVDSVNVKAKPVVIIADPGTLCSSQDSVTLFVTPKGGKWVGIANSTGKIYPSKVGAGIYNVIYKFQNSTGCEISDTLDLKITDPPFATIVPTIQVCNTNYNNNITVLNFESLISSGDKKGKWVAKDASGATGTLPILNFLGVPPGNYKFTYTTNSAKAPCTESSYTIEVVVIDCKCPSVILSPSSTLCSDNGQIDLETLKQNLNTGTWSISSSPSGGNPASINGASIFKTNNSNAGNYTITFTLNSTPPAGCPEQNTTTITVEPKPTATLTSGTKVCNQVIVGENPVTLDLTTLITAGDKSGNWVETTSSGAAGSLPNLDFTGVTPGVYTFSYTTNSAKAPCTESTFTANVIVENCECPSVALYPGTDHCNDQQTIDLDAFKITSEAGSWSVKTKPTGSNPATISGGTANINGKDGGTYIFTFTLSTPPPVGCPLSSDLTINVNASPSAVVSSSASICNSPKSGNTTVIDFSKFITSGDKTGTWVDTDGSGATGTFPNLDFNGTTPGTYTFTYSTTSASFPCTDKSYTVEVTVNNCDCPSLALTSKATLCTGGNTSIDLNTLKITPEAGSWSIKQSAPGPNPATLTGSSFNASGANAGNYIISFTLSTAPPSGCPSSADLTIEVLAKPVAVVTTTAIVCNSTGAPTPTTLNLYSLITSGDKSGVWVDNNNSGAAGPDTNLDFSGILPGNYNFTYTTGTAVSPCTESSYNVVVTVEDCECPSVATKGPGDFCNTSASFDLNSLKLTNEAGSWSITSSPPGSNPASITGNTFNGTGADAGSYTITFTLTNTPLPNCPKSSSQTFNISKALSAGTPTSPVEFCQNLGTQVNLSSLLTGADGGGTWKEVSSVPSQNNAANIANGSFNAQGQNPGTYTIQYSVTAQSPCPAAQSQVQIIINAQPIADAGVDQLITCAQQIVPVGGSGTTTGANITYSWTGGAVDNVLASSTQTNSPGTYTLSVINNTTGCKSSDVVNVSGSDDLPKPLNLVLDSIKCFGDSDGKIQFDKVKGGTGPYEVFLNDISYGKAQYFNKLPPGKYKLTIIDALGCEFNENLELTEPDEIYLNLGSDITIELGDSIMMDAFVNIPKNEIDTLLWTPIIHGLCDGCLNPVIYPYFSTPIKLEVIDVNGCHAVDEMFVYVDVKRDIYFPNVFSPNDDALNDRFYPFAGGDFIVKIHEFKVFDRWGDMVFEQFNFLPNDFEKGWDGTKNGKRLNTAVYVYYALVEFKDGKKKVFKGDVMMRNE